MEAQAPKIDYAQSIRNIVRGRPQGRIAGEIEHEGKKYKCVIADITESRGHPMYSVKIFTEEYPAGILIYIFLRTNNILPITSTISSQQAKEILTSALDTFEHTY